MSEAQAAAPAVEKTAEEKQAAEEGQGRLRAFSVGIGQLCDETGIPVDKLSKEAGVTPETLAPALVNSMAKAAEQGEGAKQGESA